MGSVHKILYRLKLTRPKAVIHFQDLHIFLNKN